MPAKHILELDATTLHSCARMNQTSHKAHPILLTGCQGPWTSWVPTTTAGTFRIPKRPGAAIFFVLLKTLPLQVSAEEFAS